jgi:UDP:flavonoid glycosyltransferase YjiC (YdhE family)
LKAVISSFGSSGDFNPCLGLARSLSENGVDVIFLANPFYEKKILQAGLRFYPAGEYFDVFKEVENNSDYLHAMKGPRVIWELVLKTVPVMHCAMKKLLIEERPDFVASHILEYGGMLAAKELSIPYATLSTTPMGWFSTAPAGHWTYTEFPLPIRSIHGRCMHFFMNMGFKYSLKPRCKKLGLPEEIGKLDDIFGKAFANLGLWSETLSGSPGDAPERSKICGFVRDEHIKDWQDVPDEIERLFEGEKKPVVVGLGSIASLHGDDIYRAAAEACKKIGRPCLLVGKDLARFADPGKNILALDFAPFGWVFPRAGLVIHHGGLNTTAEALRAGVPSLILPHAYDQFDNAIRAQHLGAACRMRVNKVTAKSLEAMLGKILADHKMHQKAKAVSQKIIAEPDGAKVACEMLVNSKSIS